MQTNMAATSQNWKRSICKQTTWCTARRRVSRKRELIHCLSLIGIYIRQHFMKIFIKKTLFFFIFLCKYVLSSYVLRYTYIRRADIDSLKLCFVYIFIFTCIQCNFIYILNIRVLIDCTSCLDNFYPMSAWSSISLTPFLKEVDQLSKDLCDVKGRKI